MNLLPVPRSSDAVCASRLCATNGTLAAKEYGWGVIVVSFLLLFLEIAN